MVLKDCSKALSISPRSSKALYRSATALLALDRLEEALDCCDRCLVSDPRNQAVQSLRSRAQNAKEAKDRQRREKEECLRKEREEKQLLRTAFKVSNHLSFSAGFEPRIGRNDTSTQPAIRRGHWTHRIHRTLILTIVLGRHSSFQFSFCILNMRSRMSLLILWKTRHSMLIFRKCFHHKRLHRTGTKGGSTQPATL